MKSPSYGLTDVGGAAHDASCLTVVLLRQVVLPSREDPPADEMVVQPAIGQGNRLLHPCAKECFLYDVLSH